MTVTDRPLSRAPVVRLAAWRLTRQRIALAVMLALAACLNLWRLEQNGYGNTYYAAAVRSMLTSWSNFFFASFDPGGFVTVDKPAAGLWIQTASAWLFGFSGISLLLPEALAGVASVGLVYYLVRCAFGTVAGLVAGLALALTPIAVAVNRVNQLDSLLVLTLLLTAWALLRANETGRLRWLLLAAALVGFGFNIKMLAAYLALPAFGLVYLVGSRPGAPWAWWRRLGYGVLAGVVLLVTSFAWAIAVDLTPADARPYVGGSQTNSELDLIFGYNGLSRLAGPFGRGRPGGAEFTLQPGPGGALPDPPGGPGGAAGTAQPPESAGGTAAPQAGQPGGAQAPAFAPNGAGFAEAPGGAVFVPPPGAAGAPGQPFPPGVPGDADGSGGPPGGPLPGGMFGEGLPGPFRLFGPALAGQISWLIPFAVIGLAAAAWRLTRRARPGWRLLRARPLGRRGQALLLWGVWLATAGAVFSFASGIFHGYYTVLVAPPTAALTGIGAVTLWREWRAGRRLGWLLPLALAATAVWHLWIVDEYPDWSRWLAPAIAGLAVAGLLLLAALRRHRKLPRRVAPAAAAALVLAVLVGPAAWAVTPLEASANAVMPTAGPARPGLRFGPGGPPGFPAPGAFAGGPGGDAGGSSAALIRFLEANRGGARYLVATRSSLEASPIIIATGEPVMAMGGFGGGDPILTPETFAALVDNHTVRFVLLGGPGPVGPGGPVTIMIPAPAPGNAPAAPAGNGDGDDRAVDAARAARGPAGFGPQNEVTAWVQAQCREVPADLWQVPAAATSSTTPGPLGPGGRGQLYDCSAGAAPR